MITAKSIPIVIVGYRNPRDVTECLEALRKSARDPAFDIYICENGGAAAFDALGSALTAPDSPCTADTSPELPPEAMGRFVRLRGLRLRGRPSRVLVAEAGENFGYAGAINAWIRVLLPSREWPGLWILNPDTQPEPRALAELVAWSTTRRLGMVGSRIMPTAESGVIQHRGLRWRKLHASTEAVGYHAPVDHEPDPDALEARLDAATGASLYITRACLDEIGLMDERYFLYFEDLDWGYRAKNAKAGGIGYAYRSVVPHHGGTTIGAVSGKRERSQLSDYLEFRNRIHFVRVYHRAWLPWTVLMLLAWACRYGLAGAPANMRAALQGLFKGLAGETGRPDRIVNAHRLK